MTREYDLLHDAVRLDPERVWERLVWHADAFIGRLEDLYRECPAIGIDISMTHVGGRSLPMAWRDASCSRTPSRRNWRLGAS